MISRAMSHHGRGDHPCHLWDDIITPEDTVLDHNLSVHCQELHLNTSASFTTSDLLGRLQILMWRSDLTFFIFSFDICKSVYHLFFVRYYCVHLGSIDEILTDFGALTCFCVQWT